MPAPKGNKYNEIWTLEKCAEFIHRVYNHVLETKDCVSIEEACCECGQYEKLVNYLQKKHNDSKDFNAIKKARAIIKQRIIKGGLKNDYNPTMSIFILKNNHDMKDKQEREYSGSINIPPIEWTK